MLLSSPCAKRILDSLQLSTTSSTYSFCDYWS